MQLVCTNPIVSLWASSEFLLLVSMHVCKDMFYFTMTSWPLHKLVSHCLLSFLPPVYSQRWWFVEMWYWLLHECNRNNKRQKLNKSNAAQDSGETKGGRAECYTQQGRAAVRNNVLRAALFNKKHLNWKKIEWIDASLTFLYFIGVCYLSVTGCRASGCYYMLLFFCLWAVVENTHPYHHYFFSFPYPFSSFIIFLFHFRSTLLLALTRQVVN